jgi:hypothetical protein
MKLQYAGDGNSVGPIRTSWLVDGTAKQRNTKGTVPCSLEKKLLTFVDRGDCCERFAGGASGARK